MAERAKFRLFPQKQGFFPFVWAVYLVMPILNLRGETGMKLILGGIMIVVFALSYRQLYWVRGGVFNVWLIIQMLIIVVLSVFYTPIICTWAFSPQILSHIIRRIKVSKLHLLLL